MEDFSEKIKKIKLSPGAGFQKFFTKMFRKSDVAPQLRNHKSKLKSYYLCIEKEHKD